MWLQNAESISSARAQADKVRTDGFFLPLNKCLFPSQIPNLVSWLWFLLLFACYKHQFIAVIVSLKSLCIDFNSFVWQAREIRSKCFSEYTKSNSPFGIISSAFLVNREKKIVSQWIFLCFFFFIEKSVALILSTWSETKQRLSLSLGSFKLTS